MRLSDSMSGLSEMTADDIQAKINALNLQLARAVGATGRIGIPESPSNTAQINAIQAQISALQTLLAQSTSSPAGIAAANKKAADDLRQQAFFLAQPGYDYGRGSSRRNIMYAGLGASMAQEKTSHSLYNLHRRDGLGDIFSDILVKARGGVLAVQKAGNAPKLPSLNVSGGPTIQLPAWLTTFVKGAAGTKTSTAVAPAPSLATGGAERPSAPPTNYLGWGVAVLAAGAAWVALRGRK